jgi:hypothetical protein
MKHLQFVLVPLGQHFWISEAMSRGHGIASSSALLVVLRPIFLKKNPGTLLDPARV